MLMTRRTFGAQVLAMVLCVVMVTSGCPTAQQWLTMVSDLLPIIGQTYLQFYGFASKNGVDAGDVALVQNLTSAGQDAIKQVEALVKDYETAPDPSTLGRANAILAGLQQSVNNFLADAQIKNSARFSQYSQFATAILADVQDVIALIPVVTTIAGATVNGAQGSLTIVKEPAKFSKAKGLKGVFSERLSRLPQ